MKLFNKRVYYLYFALFCFIVFCINLTSSYIQYKNFMDIGEQEIIAKVELVYTKTNESNKTYKILRLKTNGFSFYTVPRKNINFKPFDELKLTVINLDVKFIDYLRGVFYIPSNGITPLEKSKTPNLRQKALNFISLQHENDKISSLFMALFLGAAVSKELRDDISHWGMAHLVAISGYHLGVIMGVVFLLLAPVYRYFGARFFPYRSYKFDISVIGFALLCFYFYMIGFVPSFLRAFTMSIFGFILLCRNIKILSFNTLFIVVCFCVALFPSLLFNIGFYFSCAGVFYIFLYLHYFKDKFSILTHSLLLNFYVFLAMEVSVLYFFPLISFQQIAVIPLSYIFILFYPLSFILHLFEYGGICDERLAWFLSFKLSFTNATIPLLAFLGYNLLSLLAIKFKAVMLTLPLLGALCFIIFCIF